MVKVKFVFFSFRLTCIEHCTLRPRIDIKVIIMVSCCLLCLAALFRFLGNKCTIFWIAIVDLINVFLQSVLKRNSGESNASCNWQPKSDFCF